jgi:hypothetical protein
MMIRPMMMGAVALGVAALAGCSGTGDVISTSTDDLGKTRYHYEPSVEDVTFNAGCGIATDSQTDCSYGFVMTYVKDYVDLKTTVSHKTSQTHHTIDVTVDTWSYSKVHPMIAVGPVTYDLGTLGAKAGETYTVTVYDRKHVELWSGKVDALYHL